MLENRGIRRGIEVFVKDAVDPELPIKKAIASKNNTTKRQYFLNHVLINTFINIIVLFTNP